MALNLCRAIESLEEKLSLLVIGIIIVFIITIIKQVRCHLVNHIKMHDVNTDVIVACTVITTMVLLHYLLGM